MKELNRQTVKVNQYPTKVIQFGEGNFLRAFVDWIIWNTNQKTDFNAGVVVVQPIDRGMVDMLIFAFFPLAALFAQPLGTFSAWWPAILIGLAGAGHQAWSANMYSTIGDIFPKSTVATTTGIGGLAAGTSSFLINKGAGMLFTYSENAGAAYSFLGFEGKEAGYMTVFCICAVAYLIA